MISKVETQTKTAFAELLYPIVIGAGGAAQGAAKLQTDILAPQEEEARNAREMCVLAKLACDN